MNIQPLQERLAILSSRVTRILNAWSEARGRQENLSGDGGTSSGVRALLSSRMELMINGTA